MLKNQLCLNFAIVLFLWGCVTDGAKEQVSSFSPSSSIASPSDWTALEGIAQKNEKGLSGTLFVRKGQRQFVRGFGFADEAKQQKNSEKTISLIASNAKNFTAAAILRVVDLGKLRTDTPLAQILTEYPKEQLTWKDGTAVTIHHVLNHTSGIDDAYNYEPVKGKLFKESFGIDEVIAAVKDQPLKFKPGSRFDYSNTGYILIGEVVRRVAGTSYTDFVRKELFARASLAETFVGWPGTTKGEVAWSFDIENDSRVEVLARSKIKERHGGDVFTDGNIYTTVTDLDRWLSALVGGAILSDSSLKAMLTPGLENYGYGLGITGETGSRKISHC